MNQRELDLLMIEAQEEVDRLWEEFMQEWLAERGHEDPNGSETRED